VYMSVSSAICVNSASAQ